MVYGCSSFRLFIMSSPLQVVDLSTLTCLRPFFEIAGSSGLSFCVVCRAPFGSMDIVRLLSGVCGHGMHSRCSDVWFSENSVCACGAEFVCQNLAPVSSPTTAESRESSPYPSSSPIPSFASSSSTPAPLLPPRSFEHLIEAQYRRLSASVSPSLSGVTAKLMALQQQLSSMQIVLQGITQEMLVIQSGDSRGLWRSVDSSSSGIWNIDPLRSSVDSLRGEERPLVLAAYDPTK